MHTYIEVTPITKVLIMIQLSTMHPHPALPENNEDRVNGAAHAHKPKADRGATFVFAKGPPLSALILGGCHWDILCNAGITTKMHGLKPHYTDI